MFSDLDRQMLVVPFTVYAGDLGTAGTETVKDEISIFKMPTSGVIVGWTACYVNSSGAGPTLALTIERGTTVLDTLTTLSADETAQTNTGLAIAIAKDTAINIKGATNNTDNAFTGLVVVLYWQPLANIG